MLSDFRTLKSDLGEAVLRDLDGAAGRTHLRTKIVHLRDGDTGIVGYDDGPGALERLVQVGDEFAFFRSVHCLSPVGLGPISGPWPVAFCRPGHPSDHPSDTRGSCPLSPRLLQAADARTKGTHGSNLPTQWREPPVIRLSPVSCRPMRIKAEPPAISDRILPQTIACLRHPDRRTGPEFVRRPQPPFDHALTVARSTLRPGPIVELTDIFFM